MKRLLLLLTVFSCLSTFAATPWDLQNYSTQKSEWVTPHKKVVYTDPYVTMYTAYDINPTTTYHKARVYVEFNKSVGVPYYAIVRIYGDYVNGDWFRDFQVILSSSQWYVFQDFPLQVWDEIYVQNAELLDYGPQ